jgi:myo-inositol-1(or 4)-monophosphatase
MDEENQFLAEVEDLATRLAKEAGKLLMSGLGRIRVVEFKDRQDVVTNLDLEVEELLINKIKSRYPDHNIFSEERKEEQIRSKFTWIIDPVDGTKHYIRGLPMFCVSIALQEENDIVFGLVFNPATHELFYATKGKGAFLNGNKISVSKTNNLGDSFIYAELPNYKLSKEEFDKYHEKLGDFFQESYRVRAWGSGALGLCYVAMGGFEGYVILGSATRIYDVAAGVVIVKEAGGRVTDSNGRLFYGKPLSRESVNIIASNGQIHEQMLSLLR